MMIRAFASQRLQVEGAILLFRLRRLSKRLGLRHLRDRLARRILRLVSTAVFT